MAVSPFPHRRDGSPRTYFRRSRRDDPATLGDRPVVVSAVVRMGGSGGLVVPRLPEKSDAIARNGVLPSADIFCADGRYLRLEENWRRGLGWWVVDSPRHRTHMPLARAISMVPRGIAHEVFVEAERLVWMLELERAAPSYGAGFRGALQQLRTEVHECRELYADEGTIVHTLLADALLEVAQL